MEDLEPGSQELWLFCCVLCGARAVLSTQNVLAGFGASVGLCGCLSLCPYAAVFEECPAAGLCMGLGMRKESEEGVVSLLGISEKPFTSVKPWHPKHSFFPPPS
jgi:hypothetical protein